jgi:transcriptional regulator with XRE-family HTH domain
MELFEYVGARIRELRSTYDSGRGISQEVLAKAIGVTTNTISRWETATYHPSLDDLDRLAKFFGIAVTDFMPSTKSEKKDSAALASLMNTARQLGADDVEEVRRFAEFKMASRLYSGDRPRRGRKPRG